MEDANLQPESSLAGTHAKRSGPLDGLGIVAIGRNEGQRFVRCVESLLREGRGCPIVYVDSGSTDGSVEFARAKVVEVVQLDMSRPFTAARARNEGFERLLAISPDAAFVQFIDGDCEVIDGWLAAGVATLKADASIAAVSGRLRERFPQATLYNRLADIEWDRPVGEEKSCGGVAMMRVASVRAVGGFDPGLIAGEEPELCARMRERGGRIVRIAHDMAWHDLAMTTIAQWFKRARRHGHAIVEVSYFKTKAGRGLFAGQVRSALVWSALALAGFLCSLMGLLPVLALLFIVIASLSGADRVPEPVTTALAPLWWCFELVFSMPFAFPLAALAACGVWFAQVTRIGLKERRRGRLSLGDSLRYARLIMISKEYQARGMLDFLWRRWRGRDATVISYKEHTDAQRAASRE
jgi:GT2 family glycosyltransferase